MSKKIKAGKDYHFDSGNNQITRDNSNPNRTKWKSIRLTNEEIKQLDKYADKYADGNTSAYMIYAALHLPFYL